MGITHFRGVSGIFGLFVGRKGAEVKVADEKGSLYQNGEPLRVKVAKVSLGDADTGGGIVSWENPEDGDILITRVILDVTTAPTGGTLTVDVGTTSTSATTSSDNLIDGVDAGSGGTFDNITDGGTNGASVQKLGAGEWVTASTASGSAAGMDGNLYIHYIVA